MKNEMQALLFRRGAGLALTKLPIPEPGDSEVLVEVHFAGICGTDIHIMAGEAPSAEEVVPGHEFAGKVVAVGKNIKHLNINDMVAVDPNNYCGWCVHCRKGQVNFCENLSPVGVDRNGGWAEYSLVPGSQAYRLPRDLSPAWGSLTEPMSCILHGWDRLQPLAADSRILIIGSGIVGLLWGTLLKHHGYEQVLFSEINDLRRSIASELGFPATSPQQIAEKNVYDRSGFDIIIDCSGNPQAISEAMKLLNPLGKFLFFGVCPQHSQLQLKPFDIFKKELTLLGSVINPFTFSRAIDFLKRVGLSVENFGIKFFSLRDFQEAIQQIKKGEVNKAIFRPRNL
ncbi:MAG: alcohol dehydrogenase catalytic domain-containing protein [Calditrichia bacterium]